jgi:2,3-bisphosphoglycerate-independent phosphoglycerate mutase
MIIIDNKFLNKNSEEEFRTIIKEMFTHSKKHIGSKKYDFMFFNLSVLDHLGHTAKKDIFKRLVPEIDSFISNFVKLCIKNRYHCIITSDHGNVEQLEDQFGLPYRSHTKSKVPFFIISKKYNAKDGNILDVAPTVLKMLGIDKPEEMKGEHLLK